jgi:hypothetical protein
VRPAPSAGDSPGAPKSIPELVRRLTSAPDSKQALAAGPAATAGPTIGPEVLEAFQPSDGPGEALSEPGLPSAHARRTARPASEVVATYTDSGTKRPSPWALAGFVPVAVLVVSGGYSALWRKRRGEPA